MRSDQHGCSEVFVSVQQTSLRGRMMIESIGYVHSSLTQELLFDLPGEFWNIKIKGSLWHDYKLGWSPLTSYPTVAVDLISTILILYRTAGNFIHKRNLRDNFETYAAERENGGRRPHPENWRVRLCSHVTQSQVQAEDYLSDPESSRSNYYKFPHFDFLNGRNSLHMIKPDLAIGDKQTTIESIARSQVIFVTLLKTSHVSDQLQLGQPSMRLMTEDVMPRFNRKITERVPQVHIQIDRSQRDGS